jgi:hypothetical protein
MNSLSSGKERSGERWYFLSGKRNRTTFLIILLGDSLLRATINYPAFFKLQDILLEFKNEGVPGGFAPATVASPCCDSHPKPESAGFMRISVISHELSRK